MGNPSTSSAHRCRLSGATLVKSLVLGLATLSLLAVLSAACAPVRDFPTDPVPPVGVAGAGGEVLFSTSVLIGTSPEVEMVLAPEGEMADVGRLILGAWEQAGWQTEMVSKCSTLTVTGQLEGVEYTGRLERCPERCGEPVACTERCPEVLEGLRRSEGPVEGSCGRSSALCRAADAGHGDIQIHVWRSR